MVIKTSCEGKPTRNTALILSVTKIPYGKNGCWKNDWNHFRLTASFYGCYDTSTVGLYADDNVCNI